MCSLTPFFALSFSLSLSRFVPSLTFDEPHIFLHISSSFFVSKVNTFQINDEQSARKQMGRFLFCILLFFFLFFLCDLPRQTNKKKTGHTININGKIIVKLVCNIALLCFILSQHSLFAPHKHLSSDCANWSAWMIRTRKREKKSKLFRIESSFVRL